MMKSLGVLSYEISGRKKLDHAGANLIVANHPSLIDIVFIVSMLPEALCVVKKAAWSNPFMAGIMWATGYIRSEEHTSELQSLMRISYAVFCLKKKNTQKILTITTNNRKETQ